MVERLLRRSPPIDTEPDEQGPCLDAETLAAWTEDGLQRAEQAQVEVHLARCARCQAMLAAFGRGAPADEVLPEASWRRWGLGWLVPIAAGVAAGAIWIAVPDRKPNPQQIVVQRTDSGRPDAPPSMGPTGTQASEPNQTNRVAPLVPREAPPRDQPSQPAAADRQPVQAPGAAGRPSPASTAAVGAAEAGRLRAIQSAAESRARAFADAAQVAST